MHFYVIMTISAYFKSSWPYFCWRNNNLNADNITNKYRAKVAQTIHDGFCSAVNMEHHPQLSRGFENVLLILLLLLHAAWLWQISEGTGEWRPSTWPLVLVGNEPNEEAGESTSLRSPEDLSSHVVTLKRLLYFVPVLDVCVII